MKVLNYELIPHFHELREDGRLAVLLVLIMRSNDRNRCYPSVEKIAKDIGWSVPSVIKAKEWLLSVGAIKLVSYHERVDDEKECSKRQHIYQITGYMTINDKKIPYLYMYDMSQERNTKTSEISAGEVSPTLGKLNTSNNLVKEETKEINANALIEANAYPDANAQDVPLPFEPLTVNQNVSNSTEHGDGTITSAIENRDKGGVTPTNKRVSRKAESPDDFRAELARITKIDRKIKFMEINTNGARLYAAGYTTQDLTNFLTWWLSDEWRKKNRPVPGIKDVNTYLMQSKEYFASQVSSEPFTTSESVYGSYTPVNLNELE